MRRERAEKPTYIFFFAKQKIIWFFKSVSLVRFFQFQFGFQFETESLILNKYAKVTKSS